MSLNTTPRTWVTGEVVTAIELNTEVRDALIGIQSAWTTFVPALTNMSATTVTCKYIQIGKTVTARYLFAGVSVTGLVGIALPVTPHADYSGFTLSSAPTIGPGIVAPAGTAATRTPVVAAVSSAGNVNLAVDLAANNYVNTGVPSAWSSGVISFTVTYEAA